jgi:hypothetical protein
MDVHGVLATLVEYLPCHRCRGLEAAVANLGRLGHRERRVLVDAPEPGGVCKVPVCSGESRAAAEALGRAVRRLNRAGLVTLEWSDGHVTDRRGIEVRRHRRALRRTALGQAIVDRLAPRLRSRRRNRWAAHRRELLRLRACTTELIAGVYTEIVTTISEVRAFASLPGLGGLGRVAEAARVRLSRLLVIEKAMRASIGNFGEERAAWRGRV